MAQYRIVDKFGLEDSVVQGETMDLVDGTLTILDSEGDVVHIHRDFLSVTVSKG